ncbi:hypothetical protein D3C87_2045740 [compost metagenome]
MNAVAANQQIAFGRGTVRKMSRYDAILLILNDRYQVFTKLDANIGPLSGLA